MGPEGARTVGEAEIGSGREPQHVGAVVPTVRTSVTPSNGASTPKPVRTGQIAVGHRDPAGAGPGQPVDSGPHRTVEALSRLPHDGGAHLRRPLRHAPRRRRPPRRATARTRPPRVPPWRARARCDRDRRGRSPACAWPVEGLDRDQHHLGAESERRPAAPHAALAARWPSTPGQCRGRRPASSHAAVGSGGMRTGWR